MCKRTTILNLGAGKIKPLDYDKLAAPKFLLNVDSSYYCSSPDIENIIEAHQLFLDGIAQSYDFNLKEDVFTFLQRYHIPFSRITIYRFLEHVKRTDILHFIYLLSTCLEVGGEVDCIVPNYYTLAQRILAEKPGRRGFEEEDIITTTELLNEPSMPHASIWTVERVYHFFHLEERFNITYVETDYSFDGRDIYLRFLAERVR